MVDGLPTIKRGNKDVTDSKWIQNLHVVVRRGTKFETTSEKISKKTAEVIEEVVRELIASSFEPAMKCLQYSDHQVRTSQYICYFS